MDIQVVSDTLQILPIMSELHELLITLKDKKLTDSDKERVYRLTREMRQKACEVSLLPTIEDELKDIDTEVARDRLIRLAKRILPDVQVKVWEAEADEM